MQGELTVEETFDMNFHSFGKLHCHSHLLNCMRVEARRVL